MLEEHSVSNGYVWKLEEHSLLFVAGNFRKERNYGLIKSCKSDPLATEKTWVQLVSSGGFDRESLETSQVNSFR